MNTDAGRPKWKIKIAKALDHWGVVIFMTVITIYALFADDIRLLALPSSTDEAFWGISCFAMACFLIEIILASIAVEGYLFSFFFWLDLVSTISMIPDIGWIW